MASNRPRFSTQLALLFGGLMAGATLITSLGVSWLAARRLHDSVGEQVATIAGQLRDKLDRGMFERYRDIRIAAELSDSFRGDRERRRWLESLQQSFPDYAWLGIASPEGKVRVSANGLLEGADVSGRPWFQQGQRGPYVGDVHDALLLAKKLKPDSKEPLRFVDIAFPIPEKNRPSAVLGAHLSWRWAREVEDSILTSYGRGLSLDVLVVNAEGVVLLGPEALREKSLGLTGFVAWRKAGEGYARASWGDGRDYLVGYSRSRGYRDYPGLGWTVLVRAPVARAFAPVSELRQAILGLGLVAATLGFGIAWLAARRVTRPLLEIASEAEALRQGRKHDDIHERREFAELELLSRSLHSLTADLRRKQQALNLLNADLDTQVQHRTRELSDANTALTAEIAARAQAEQEREALIRQLEEMAHSDALTGLANRRYFFQIGGRMLKQAKRSGKPVALLALDIDHFKAINDEHGHAGGDEALAVFAGLLQASVREVDVAARLGGEEFAVLMEATDLVAAEAVAERIRAGVENLDVEGPQRRFGFTVSIGLAVQAEGEEALDSLMLRADKALYAAKHGGRNRVRIAGIGSEA